jgi:ATP-dependent HslUV protease subunit HslV
MLRSSRILLCQGAKRMTPSYHMFHSHRILQPFNIGQQTRSTTVLCVRKNNQVALIADGQVTQGSCVIKANAHKLRLIESKGNSVLVGFAGSTADAITLFERLESKLDEYPGQLLRSCVELAKLWRTDKYLRRLEAVMIVADKKTTLLLSGTGDVLEPPDGILGIGSGGQFAIAAAKACIDNPDLTAYDVALRAMKIAGEICIYTNTNFTELLLDANGVVSTPPATGTPQ